MSDASLQQLELHWNRAEDFLECFDDGPTRRIRTSQSIEQWPEIGAMCSLLLRFADRGTEFQIHAVLIKREEEVAVFELVPEEQMRHELVLVSARGESLPYRRRRHTRVPCRLVVNGQLDNGGSFSAHATTFGAGGVHLALDNPVATDRRIAMTIVLSDGRRLALNGRVTSCIDLGPERGNSVEFLFESAAQRDEVKAVAAELEGAS